MRASRPRPSEGEGPGRERGLRLVPVWTVGGFVSHVGAAVLLIGLVCLVDVRPQGPDVLLVKDLPANVLNGQYTITYRGQTSDYQTDHNNALRFDVVSRDGTDTSRPALPFALRADRGRAREAVSATRPSSTTRAATCIWPSSDGPDEFYPRGRFPDNAIELGRDAAVRPVHDSVRQVRARPAGRRDGDDRPDAGRVPRLGRSCASPTRADRRWSGPEFIMYSADTARLTPQTPESRPCPAAG